MREKSPKAAESGFGPCHRHAATVDIGAGGWGEIGVFKGRGKEKQKTGVSEQAHKG